MEHIPRMKLIHTIPKKWWTNELAHTYAGRVPRTKSKTELNTQLIKIIENIATHERTAAATKLHLYQLCHVFNRAAHTHAESPAGIASAANEEHVGCLQSFYVDQHIKFIDILHTHTQNTAVYHVDVASCHTSLLDEIDSFNLVDSFNQFNASVCACNWIWRGKMQLTQFYVWLAARKAK